MASIPIDSIKDKSDVVLHLVPKDTMVVVRIEC